MGDKRRRKSSVELLVDKLRAFGIGIPRKYIFRRCRPGHWQRAAGAFSWTISWKYGTIGSPENVECCVRFPIEWGPHGDTIYADVPNSYVKARRRATG